MYNIIIANDRANVRPIRTGIKYVDWPITEHAGWSMLTTCNKHDGVGGEEHHGPLVTRFSRHTASTLHMLLLALFTPPAFCCHPGMKEIKQDAALVCTTWITSRRPFDGCNNDYVTAFHLASQTPVEDSQRCTTDMNTQLIKHAPPRNYYISAH